VIQHIYDEHFEGVRRVEQYQETWNKLRGKIEQRDFTNVQTRLAAQLASAIQWRDVANTYFYRHSGVEDERKNESGRVKYA
jgi:alpha-glucuronidase